MIRSAASLLAKTAQTVALATVPELALGAALLLGALPTQAMPLLGPDANDACGRVLASNGAVTPDQNEVSRNCLGILAGSDGLGGGPQAMFLLPQG